MMNLKVVQKSDIMTQNLAETICLWSYSSDMSIISEEGAVTHISRHILALHSQYVRNILMEYSMAGNMAGINIAISVPATEAAIKRVIKIITTGGDETNNANDRDETINTAKLLGINIDSLVAEEKKSRKVFLNVKNEVSEFNFDTQDEEAVKKEKLEDTEETSTAKVVNFKDVLSRPFICNKCTATFTRKDHLKRHTDRRHEEKSLYPKCDGCSKTFETLEYLQKHINICSHKDFESESLIIDSQSKKMKGLSNILFGKVISEVWACKKCYNVFESKQSKEEHFKTCAVSQKESFWNAETKKYRCPFCEKVLKTQHVVWFAGHMKECHTTGGIKKKFKPVFACEVCGKEFKLKSTLKMHKVVHSTERPFQCDICDKSYKVSVDLTYHMKKHDDTFEYSCEICAKQFKCKKVLRSHLKSHLSEAEKTHICTECGYKFGRKEHLRNHIQTHSIIPNFFCDVCGAGFKTKEQNRQHTKKHH